MKRTLFAILNKPLYVALGSLVIAVVIGTWVLLGGSSAAQAKFVTAGPGNISMTGQAVQGSGATNLTLAFQMGGQITNVSAKVGQTVKKGDVLATLDPKNTVGGLTQAQAGYDTAQANYQKVLNGATGPAIDAAKAAVHTATVARDQAKDQQAQLVKNAYAALLNATPQAYPENSDNTLGQTAPTVSGSYTLGKEGDITIEVYTSASDSGYSFRLSGLVSGTGTVSTDTPQPLGNSGLYIQFPVGYHGDLNWIVSIPNTKASDYIAKYNAYQTALQTQTQTLATADAAVQQAESNLNVTAAAARPEDVASAAAQVESAKGALQVAQAAYDQYRIVAPGDGTITAVHVSAGQTATANAPAIEMSGTSFAKSVAVSVPNSAIITNNGKTYVRVKSGSGTVEKEVTTGIHDASTTEIVSGLSAGDQVAVQ